MNTLLLSSKRTRPASIGASGGFALLETLVALVLFSIGIMGLLGLQARAIIAEGDAENRNRAALIVDRCVSNMQLQANQVTMTGGAADLMDICQTKTWSDYVKDPKQGGLPNGLIKVTAHSAYGVVSGGAPLAPVNVSVTLQWTPPSRADAASSQFTTTATLLVQNR
jgi:type IV pilus assembly protein PilV